MDIEKQESLWAKSTQSRIQVFLDSFLIRSPTPSVRNSSQRLLLSLFKKGNEQQRLRIMSLLESRCDQLTWMGKASEQFLNLIKNIFNSTSSYPEYKRRTLNKIFSSMSKIHQNMITNSNYEFYSFASNLIDFGNEQFKPYLLEANGCLHCFGSSQQKPQPFKLQNSLQTMAIFNNKFQYTFKRIYDVKQLTINLKCTSRAKGITVYYLNPNKEYVKIGNKYKSNQTISAQSLTLQGFMFQFDMVYSGHRKKIACVFCDQPDKLNQYNGVCNECSKRVGQLIEINGQFKAVGVDQKLISQQLCSDYQKIQQNISTIRTLHRKIEQKQKITLNFKLDQMLQIYQRIVNNLRSLHQKNPSALTAKQDQKCFSCNYYEIYNIVKFLKEMMKKCNNIPLSNQEICLYKQTIRNCLWKNQIELLKGNLLETLAVVVVNVGKSVYKEEFMEDRNKYVADLIAKVLIALKQKRHTLQAPIDDQLTQIRQFLQHSPIPLKTQQRIQILVCYFIDWQILNLLNSNNFNHTTQINRLTTDQYSELKSIINFDLTQIFNLRLNNYLKVFLKIIPANLLPSASLDIADCQFLQYVDNKIPDIDTNKVQESIICCPNPMIKLDMFISLPILISKLPVRESIKVMNSLFPYRAAWNLNIMKACTKFDAKLTQLPAEEQISTCLQGYSKSSQYLYINKIYKLLVPQRLQFIIRLEAPQAQIEANSVQYSYLPIKQVRSQDLQGDTIRALHDWVYAELVKIGSGMPLDIIVQKNIIDNMDFPIQLVYQNIVENKIKRKLGDKQYEFFRVIYRIQGIMGEPKQRSIGNLRDQKLQTCISHASYFLNKFSDDFSKKIGLDVLIQILQQIAPGSENEEKKVVLFEILSTLSMNQAICKKIVEGQYGDSIINATVKLMSFQNEKDAKITNFLLQLSSKVIDQANQEMINLRKGSVGEYRKMSGNMDIEQTGGSDSERKVKFVLNKINECENTYLKTGNLLYKDISKRLIKLLPFCSKDELESSQQLFTYFDFSNWNKKSSSKLQSLFVFMDSLSQTYMTFKSLSIQKGVTPQIIKTITSAIRKQGTSEIEQKKLSSTKQTTQLIESALLLLCALIQGDQNLQSNLFQSKLFHNIYEISQIPPMKAVQINAGKIPENCYKIVKYLGSGKIIYSGIHQFLEEKKKIQKEKNQPKKNKKWEMLKSKQQNFMGKKMENQAQEGQKDFIICSSCQQGYSKKKEILGLYIYLTKNQIPYQANWWKDSRRSPSLTSSTYFTAIHFECHNKAYEADQKIPRSQWDGALIRNMDVLCNSWIPFKGPKTTLEQFSKVDRKYFERNKNGNYWNVVNDLYSLIEKLSIQFDFAAESKGSSYSHNCKLIPVLIGFACHMIQRGGGCAVIEEGVNYLMDNPPKKIVMIDHLICYSIFVMNYEWFQKSKPTLIKWLQTRQPDIPQQKQYQNLRPHYLLLKIIQQIFQIIHKKIEPTPPTSKIWKQLDTYISTNLHTIIPEFERLSDQYKSKYTKFGSVEEFGF